jgi:NAD(P)-dependent dehydrogenase (short-subunit alcohol dehydrogenase family)
MLCDIEEQALKKAVADLKTRTNVDVDGVKADVSLKGELQAAADPTVARYGRIHILVNNAGVGASISGPKISKPQIADIRLTPRTSSSQHQSTHHRCRRRTAKEGRLFPRRPSPD